MKRKRNNESLKTAYIAIISCLKDKIILHNFLSGVAIPHSLLEILFFSSFKAEYLLNKLSGTAPLSSKFIFSNSCVVSHLFWTHGLPAALKILSPFGTYNYSLLYSNLLIFFSILLYCTHLTHSCNSKDCHYIYNKSLSVLKKALFKKSFWKQKPLFTPLQRKLGKGTSTYFKDRFTYWNFNDKLCVHLNNTEKDRV